MASGYVYFGEGSEAIIWQSAEYYDLYFQILRAKFIENQEAKAALLATGNSMFSHVLPNGEGLDTEQFQVTHLCKSLYEIRNELMK